MTDAAEQGWTGETDAAERRWGSKPVQGMIERSGPERTTDPLVVFLYYLARDELPTGTLEGALENALYLQTGEPLREARFSNGYLARWAKDARDRLRGWSERRDEPETEGGER